jgi:mRNA interferase MazF
MKQFFYVPERGDVVRISRPTARSILEGGRPGADPIPSREVLILSPQAYNRRTGLAVACPIVRPARGYPFEVLIPSDAPVGGVALADQVFSFDWRSRRAERISSLLPDVIEEALGKIRTLLG